jgi:triacylglycerol lipase
VTAKLQRITVGLLLAAALLWLAFQASRGNGLLGLVGAIVLLNIQPLVLAFEFFVLVPWINRHDTAPRASWRQLGTAWCVESITAHAVFSWRQPFRSRACGDTLGLPLAAGRRPVVLVHGFFCNRGLWNPWVRRLDAMGIPHEAVDLEPPFAAIDQFVPIVDAAVRRAREATGLAPVLVGHSMGGLAIRAWCRHRGAQALEMTERIVTIGSPHAGTFTARFARADNARQMGLTSDWLRALADAEGAALRSHFTCFWSHCDNVVMPASTATLPGADNRHLPGQAHVAMVFAPPVLDEVVRLATAATAAPARLSSR